MILTKNAVITSASITTERDILSAWLYLDYGDGTCQGFGGHALYLPCSYKHHELKSFAGHFIYLTMQVAGVENWDKLTGKSIRVKHNENGVYAIGHIVKELWFNPTTEFMKGTE